MLNEKKGNTMTSRYQNKLNNHIDNSNKINSLMCKKEIK